MFYSGPYIREVRLTESDVSWAGAGELLTQDNAVFIPQIHSDQIAHDFPLSTQDEEEKWVKGQADREQIAHDYPMESEDEEWMMLCLCGSHQKKFRKCIKYKVTQCKKYLISSSASRKHS